MVERNRIASTMGAVAALIGLIVLASAFLIAVGTGMFWLHLVSGVALLAIGWYVMREARAGNYASWAGIVLALVGALILISPIVWRPTVEWHAWVNYITGALLIVLGGYDAYRAQDDAAEHALAAEE